ncbi:MAG: hypothetical protein AB1521_03065 [Bacteroidota bacterium]
MKKILINIFLITFYISAYAQVNVDSVLSEGKFIHPDSIKISDLVKQQVEEARLKARQKEEEYQQSKQYQARIIPVNIAVPKKVLRKDSFGFFNSISAEVKIFLLISFLLILSVAARRYFINFKKKVKSQLKKKIAFIREENVIVKKNRKKIRIRKLIARDKKLAHMTEKNMTRKAKELEISKGELILAARLKFLEYGKM